MKTFKHFLTAALVAASTASFAQTALTDEDKPKCAKAFERITDDLHIYVGLNNFGGSVPAGYELRPIGSRFVALSWQYRIPLVVNNSFKIRLAAGPEVAWNNFMFEGNNTLVERNDQLNVEPSNRALKKSKLTTAQINLPVILNVTFRSGFRVGMGAYAGLRLDSYTKEKPETGSVVRTHGSFNLNPVRWGLKTELGFRNHAQLFFRYEPNRLFQEDQGPDLNVWSVGVKL